MAMTKTAVEDGEGGHMHWDGRAKELCIEAAEKVHRRCIEALARKERCVRKWRGLVCVCIHT